MANENSELFLPILPPYSLNLDWDSGDPEYPNGNFLVLKNYIPEGDILRVRNGITIFAHTPA